MKYSGIGGQAVMEGVMMRNGARYALAVRKSDHTIAVETHKTRDPSGGIYQIPILRGIVSFVDSLVMGMSTLMQSAAYFEDEEEAEAGKQKDPPLFWLWRFSWFFPISSRAFSRELFPLRRFLSSLRD